ncbi:amidohydrolase [Leptobacterium sp. I13]|uniref:amidohydrolase n=1 Tax=Leptobacterium meishanense TaxID=3128904 RepID=UPI0030EBC718
MQQLKVALIQTSIIWESPKENRLRYEEKLKTIDEPVDLIIFPEMFTTGFTMNAMQVAEAAQGETINWLKTKAQEMNTAICGSIVIRENNKYYNRFLFAYLDGSIEKYDKRHTFTLAGEDKVYEAGKERKTINYKGWRICPQICYDLRFPVWARNIDNYDLLLYVANWPKPRINAWDVLLKARAIENMAYCIGVNRVGVDTNGYEYPGHSGIYDVLGNELVFSKKEEILIVNLDKEHMNRYRNKLKFLSDRDSFTLV